MSFLAGGRGVKRAITSLREGRWVHVGGGVTDPLKETALCFNTIGI